MTPEEWLAHYCADNDIDWTKMTKAETFQLSMVIPCTIRCFRVGGAVDPLAIGERCPECGKVHKDVRLKTRYDVIVEGVI